MKEWDHPTPIEVSVNTIPRNPVNINLFPLAEKKSRLGSFLFYLFTMVFPLYSPQEHILCGSLYSPQAGHFTNVGAANL